MSLYSRNSLSTKLSVIQICYHVTSQKIKKISLSYWHFSSKDKIKTNQNKCLFSNESWHYICVIKLDLIFQVEIGCCIQRFIKLSVKCILTREINKQVPIINENALKEIYLMRFYFKSNKMAETGNTIFRLQNLGSSN